MLERLSGPALRVSSTVVPIASHVQRVTLRAWSGGNVLATEMTCTRVGEVIVGGRPGREVSWRPVKPSSWERRRHWPAVRLAQPNARLILRLVGRSGSPALRMMRARKASDGGVEEARAKACRSARAFCAQMMRGAMGVGLGCLLAKRP